MRQLQRRSQVNLEYQAKQERWKEMRRTIRRTIEQYPDWTNAQISRQMKCSDRLVSKVRRSVKRPLDKVNQEKRRQTLVRLAVGYQNMGMSVGEIASEFTRMKIPTVDLKKLTWTTRVVKALVENGRAPNQFTDFGAIALQSGESENSTTIQ